MAQISGLYPTGTPGRPYAFAPKSGGGPTTISPMKFGFGTAAQLGKTLTLEPISFGFSFGAVRKILKTSPIKFGFRFGSVKNLSAGGAVTGWVNPIEHAEIDHAEIDNPVIGTEAP
jgi:hypothetical protein